MNDHSTERGEHRHDYLPDHGQAERGTTWVMGLTAVTMVVEIISGSVLGSMALLADGWHMATHVVAFAIAIYAYRFARRHARDPRFAFGTGKVTVLSGFASAVALAVVALVMAVESVVRLLEPREIRFDEATWVAVLGLVVNLVSGLILHRAGHHPPHGHADHHEHHEHDHDHEHEHEHEHADHNLRAAYLHVLADALTSVLAIIALLGARYLGLHWLDAAMGLVGAALITHWAWGLLRETATVLLDRPADDRTRAAIERLIREEPDHEIVDLHVWPVGAGTLAASVSIVSRAPRATHYYRRRLEGVPGLVHIVVEVNPYRDADCPT